MGWKGALRSIAAAARAAERDAQRRHNAALKVQMAANTAEGVADWERYVENLVSVHADLADAIDWQSIASQPKPEAPLPVTTQQERARRALEAFRPSLLDVFRGGSAKCRQRLEADLRTAPSLDAAAFDKNMAAYRDALSEWETDTELARRLCAGDAAALKEVITEMQSLSRESLIGSAVSFSIGDGFVHAEPEVHSDDIIPRFRRKQLASGRLSETKIPVSQFNELYQDYVASVALKVAGDLFQITPLDEVYVTCLARMLDASTGHQEMTPILSVQFVRRTFVRLNLAHLDPSDSMINFNHVTEFKKTKGFSRIKPLEPVEAR
jgi:hypothetical protein